MDVPAAQYGQSISFSVLLQNNGTRWNTGVDCLFGICDDYDNIPVVNADAQVFLTKELRLMFGLNDVIKLASNKTRKYASSQYKQESGSANLLLKFQF